ncbi:MAG: hypothetical protein WBX50_04075 [Candidatus Deferrimicrobiaceae bacterium]
MAASAGAPAANREKGGFAMGNEGKIAMVTGGFFRDREKIPW